MKTLSNITRDIIRERGLDYTPSLFNEILAEVTLSKPNHNLKRESMLNSNKNKDYSISFMELNLSTDSRLK